MLTKTQKAMIWYAGQDNEKIKQNILEQASEYLKPLKIEPEDLKEAIEMYCGGVYDKRASLPISSDREKIIEEISDSLLDSKYTSEQLDKIKEMVKHIQ